MEDPAALSSNWLFVGLLVLALVALGLAAYGWQRSRRRNRRSGAPLPEHDADLGRLGLSEVRARPASRPAEAPATVSQDEPPPARPEPEAASETAPSAETEAHADRREDRPKARMENPDRVSLDEAGISAPRPVVPAPPPSTPREGPHVARRSPLWDAADPDAVAALLASLKAAIGAQGVALLRYDEGADAYALDLLAGHAPSARTAPLPAAGSALHQVPDDRSISLLEGDALGALGYHPDPATTVGHAAALTVDGPATRVLLVADGAAGTVPFATRHLTLLGAYADLLGHLLGGAGVETVEEGAGDAEEEAEAPEGARAVRAAAEESGPVRPRAEIVAEEMAAARAAEQPLALALVVLRDAERVGGEGPEAVAEAEEALFERLRHVDGSTRVERFGELMAGVFCHTGPTFVEAWAERVAAAGPPVHIGIALLRARHLNADALRADAAAALRDAYERGEDCVILE